MEILLNVLIILGGLFNLGFAIFHCFFWKVFRWQKDLALVARVNRNIFQILNLCLIFVLVAFALISFLCFPELLRTGVGRWMLLIMGLFWLFRGIEQIVFFGFKNVQSLLFTVIFFFGFLLYIIPFLLAMYLTVSPV
jgi:hypothetical protein